MIETVSHKLESYTETIASLLDEAKTKEDLNLFCELMKSNIEELTAFYGDFVLTEKQLSTHLNKKYEGIRRSKAKTKTKRKIA